MNAADHCVFLPRMDQARFVAAMRQCDIFLDSLEWSGCTTSLECLQHDLPMVTMAGAMMRGRHTAAFLKMMDVIDVIAGSIDDYVSIATRLGQDAAWRADVKRRISANKHRIYRDRACIAGLEHFMERAARDQSQS